MLGSPLTRYLGKVNSPTRPHLPAEDNEAVILWAMIVHWWGWCGEQAKAGWMFTLIVLGTLFLVYALRLEAQSGELLRQCVGIQ